MKFFSISQLLGHFQYGNKFSLRSEHPCSSSYPNSIVSRLIIYAKRSVGFSTFHLFTTFFNMPVNNVTTSFCFLLFKQLIYSQLRHRCVIKVKLSDLFPLVRHCTQNHVSLVPWQPSYFPFSILHPGDVTIPIQIVCPRPHPVRKALSSCPG